MAKYEDLVSELEAIQKRISDLQASGLSRRSPEVKELVRLRTQATRRLANKGAHVEYRGGEPVVTRRFISNYYADSVNPTGSITHDPLDVFADLTGIDIRSGRSGAPVDYDSLLRRVQNNQASWAEAMTAMPTDYKRSLPSEVADAIVRGLSPYVQRESQRAEPYYARISNLRSELDSIESQLRTVSRTREKSRYNQLNQQRQALLGDLSEASYKLKNQVSQVAGLQRIFAGLEPDTLGDIAPDPLSGVLAETERYLSQISSGQDIFGSQTRAYSARNAVYRNLINTMGYGRGAQVVIGSGRYKGMLGTVTGMVDRGSMFFDATTGGWRAIDETAAKEGRARSMGRRFDPTALSRGTPRPALSLRPSNLVQESLMSGVSFTNAVPTVNASGTPLLGFQLADPVSRAIRRGTPAEKIDDALMQRSAAYDLVAARMSEKIRRRVAQNSDGVSSSWEVDQVRRAYRNLLGGTESYLLAGEVDTSNMSSIRAERFRRGRKSGRIDLPGITASSSPEEILRAQREALFAAGIGPNPDLARGSGLPSGSSREYRRVLARASVVDGRIANAAPRVVEELLAGIGATGGSKRASLLYRKGMPNAGMANISYVDVLSHSLSGVDDFSKEVASVLRRTVPELMDITNPHEALKIIKKHLQKMQVPSSTASWNAEISAMESSLRRAKRTREVSMAILENNVASDGLYDEFASINERIDEVAQDLKRVGTKLQKEQTLLGSYIRHYEPNTFKDEARGLRVVPTYQSDLIPDTPVAQKRAVVNSLQREVDVLQERLLTLSGARDAYTDALLGHIPAVERETGMQFKTITDKLARYSQAESAQIEELGRLRGELGRLSGFRDTSDSTLARRLESVQGKIRSLEMQVEQSRAGRLEATAQFNEFGRHVETARAASKTKEALVDQVIGNKEKLRRFGAMAGWNRSAGWEKEVTRRLSSAQASPFFGRREELMATMADLEHTQSVLRMNVPGVSDGIPLQVRQVDFLGDIDSAEGVTRYRMGVEFVGDDLQVRQSLAALYGPEQADAMINSRTWGRTASIELQYRSATEALGGAPGDPDRVYRSMLAESYDSYVQKRADELPENLTRTQRKAQMRRIRNAAKVHSQEAARLTASDMGITLGALDDIGWLEVVAHSEQSDTIERLDQLRLRNAEWIDAVNIQPRNKAEELQQFTAHMKQYFDEATQAVDSRVGGSSQGDLYARSLLREADFSPPMTASSVGTGARTNFIEDVLGRIMPQLEERFVGDTDTKITRSLLEGLTAAAESKSSRISLSNLTDEEQARFRNVLEAIPDDMPSVKVSYNVYGPLSAGTQVQLPFFGEMGEALPKADDAFLKLGELFNLAAITRYGDESMVGEASRILGSGSALQPERIESHLVNVISSYVNQLHTASQGGGDHFAGINRVFNEAISAATDLPGAEGAEQAARAATVAGSTADGLKAFRMSEFADLWRSSPTWKVGTAIGAGLALMGIIRSRRTDERPFEEMRGPRYLPGGEFYEGSPQFAPQYEMQGQGGQEQWGTTYEVTARGAFDPHSMQNQLQALIGGDMSANIYNSRAPL